jgi:hypothetical protein
MKDLSYMYCQKLISNRSLFIFKQTFDEIMDLSKFSTPPWQILGRKKGVTIFSFVTP